MHQNEYVQLGSCYYDVPDLKVSLYQTINTTRIMLPKGWQVGDCDVKNYNGFVFKNNLNINSR